MILEQTVTLDLLRKEQEPRIRTKQGDAGSRLIRILLTCDGEAYAIPEGATAHFRFAKQDGTMCLNPVQIQQDGSITVELTEQMLAVSGIGVADLILFDADGDRLSTMNFWIQVEPSPQCLDLDSKNEMQTLLQLISYAQGLKDGTSAYETAVELGFEGTREEWLQSMKGEKGEKGDQGEVGDTPLRGTDYWTAEDRQFMVREVLAELPVAVTEDGYTDLAGLRKVTALAMSRTGQSVTIGAALQGGKAVQWVIHLNDNGFPVSVVTEDGSCGLSWNGFSDEVPALWEGGSY